jgi:hypothetical protein
MLTVADKTNGIVTGKEIAWKREITSVKICNNYIFTKFGPFPQGFGMNHTLFLQ